MGQSQLDQLCINTIRTLSIDAIQEAESGHPGLPMGAAPMAYTLWVRFLKHNPKNPKWYDRDRFVLSAGHGSMLLYSLLHLTGYDLPLNELKRFRQWGSRTPGHPESFVTVGVETTTGPLGQGAGNAVGMAMAEEYLASYFNRPGYEIVNHYTYALVSDGDLMEGVSAEAASLAGHLKLGKLIFLYDNNNITIDGRTELAFSGEDVSKRFEAYGWHVQNIDGMNIEEVEAALKAAREETGRPSFINCKTIIGFGSPNKAGTSKVHGAALGEEEIKLTKENLGFPPDQKFYIPEEALTEFRKAVDKGVQKESEWDALYGKYKAEFPDLAKEWESAQSGKLPEGWNSDLPQFKPEDGSIATRAAFGKALNAIAPKVPWLIGGSADLAESTNTDLHGESSFAAGNYKGRILHWGIREHAMGSTLNGMHYHGGVRGFGSTFMVFSDYMRPAVRLACLAELNPIFVWTHDSVGLGEDGPTHQPVEHLAALRAIPRLAVIRPADASETSYALESALNYTEGPSALILSRQKLPIIDRSKYASAEGARKGAYVLAGSPDETPEVIIISTGSEVQFALGAYEKLTEEGVKARVVSMPSWELFEAQPQEYRDTVLPPSVKARLSVEAAVTFGWQKWVGDQGDSIGQDEFGHSAPLNDILSHFGYTKENVYQRAKALLEKLHTAAR